MAVYTQTADSVVFAKADPAKDALSSTNSNKQAHGWNKNLPEDLGGGGPGQKLAADAVRDDVIQPDKAKAKGPNKKPKKLSRRYYSSNSSDSDSGWSIGSSSIEEESNSKWCKNKKELSQPKVTSYKLVGICEIEIEI